MYYDDQSRRFNLVSGLLCGTVLGAGLALLLAPQDRVRLPALARGRSASWRARAGRGARALGRRAGQAVRR